MTTKYKGCNYCRHFRADGSCPAFDPGVVPIWIADGRFKHIEPWPSQKNTIVYEYTEKSIATRLRLGEVDPPGQIPKQPSEENF